jgi:hypothetical protein
MFSKASSSINCPLEHRKPEDNGKRERFTKRMAWHSENYTGHRHQKPQAKVSLSVKFSSTDTLMVSLSFP